MNILIIESGAHEQIIQPACEILSDKNNNKISIFALKQRKKWFPEWVVENFTIHLSSSFLFWYKAIYLSRYYENIFIFTPPEYNNTWRGLFNNISFLLFLFLFKKKIVIRILNTERWKVIRGSSLPMKLSSLIRLTALKFIRLYAFEYHAIYKSLPEAKPYTLFPAGYWKENKKNFSFQQKLKIGFLGNLDAKKRDFTLLIRTLESLSKEIRNEIIIFFPSPISNPHQNEIIKKINKYVEISLNDDRTKYMSHLESSDIFLGLIKKDLGYGEKKGTGIFGDALTLNRKVIAPIFCDPNKEYEKIAIYYKNNLDNIIRQLVLAKEKKETNVFDINPSYMKCYSKSFYYNAYVKLINSRNER
jgi:hypothetical protein